MHPCCDECPQRRPILNFLVRGQTSTIATPKPRLGVVAYDVGFRPYVKLEFANATTTLTSNVIGNSGPILGFDAAAPPLISNTKVSLDPTNHGGSADMKPQRANIMLQGFTDVGTSAPAPRSFSNMSYEFLRVTKGEKE